MGLGPFERYKVPGIYGVYYPMERIAFSKVHCGQDGHVYNMWVTLDSATDGLLFVRNKQDGPIFGHIAIKNGIVDWFSQKESGTAFNPGLQEEISALVLREIRISSLK